MMAGIHPQQEAFRADNIHFSSHSMIVWETTCSHHILSSFFQDILEDCKFHSTRGQPHLSQVPSCPITPNNPQHTHIHTHTHTHTHTHHTTHTHTHTHTHTRAQGVGYDSSWAAITGTDRFIRYLQTTSRRKWKVKFVLQLERAKLVSKSGVSKPIPCDKKFLVWKLSNSIPKFKPNRKKISESKSGILRHYFN